MKKFHMDSFFKSKLILKSSLYICDDVIRKKFDSEGLVDSIEILKKTNIYFTDKNWLNFIFIIKHV